MFDGGCCNGRSARLFFLVDHSPTLYAVNGDSGQRHHAVHQIALRSKPAAHQHFHRLQKRFLQSRMICWMARASPVFAGKPAPTGIAPAFKFRQDRSSQGDSANHLKSGKAVVAKNLAQSDAPNGALPCTAAQRLIVCWGAASDGASGNLVAMRYHFEASPHVIYRSSHVH